MNLFSAYFSAASFAQEAKAAIEQVSVTDTNTAIAKAVSDVGYTGTVEAAASVRLGSRGFRVFKV